MLRLFLIVILCWAGQSAAWAEVRLPQAGEVSLGRHWELLRDPQDALTVEQLSRPEIAAAFRPQGSPPALGYVKGAVWLRITLTRPAQAAPVWLLQLRSALLDDVTLFLPQRGGGYEQRVAGDRQPVAGRDVNYRSPVFRLDLPADQPVTLYLRVRSTSTLSFPLVVWSPEAFISFIGTELLLFGLFYAAHLVLLITSVWFYWVTRNISFGLFSLTVLANLFISLGAEGFIYQYLLPEWPLASETLYVLSWFSVTPLGIMFTMHYHGLFAPPWRRSAVGFSLLAWGVALVSASWLLLGNVWWIRPMALLWGIAIMVIQLIVATVMAWRGQKAARVLVFVLVLLLGGTVLRLARNVGWIEPGSFVDNANYLGMVAFLLIMNSAISWRYTDMRAEKEAAQAEALRVAHQAERDLELKVALRTQALRDAMAQVEASLSLERRAQEEQRQFLSTVSHELRTPLAVIDATAQNLDLDDAHDDPRTSARYQKILRATQRLTMLLNDSLHEDGFELLRHGSRPSRTSLPDLLEDAAAAARLLSEGHQLEVDGSRLPEAILCDASLLRLALRTLADNAVKYTPVGSRVVLGGRLVAEGVELEVRDNGPGIDPADLPRIFDRFYRGQNAGQKPGTGLGLSLARRMVEMQGGTLALESMPGQGCRARIFLPSAQPGLQAGNQASSQACNQASEMGAVNV
ncbi:sensor histidine kinase [Cupriavidus basilensis]|uniref:sensor histidine kinase n=1 Tax=Cupriavidus basilensis TaxID=68895 RepID=UPI0023E88490|nr:sensor histidine kinase [Cupriavidus basilensis]MDF3882531.1 sensor histidine kinase [Cupriavidus basilensis]